MAEASFALLRSTLISRLRNPVRSHGSSERTYSARVYRTYERLGPRTGGCWSEADARLARLLRGGSHAYTLPERGSDAIEQARRSRARPRGRHVQEVAFARRAGARRDSWLARRFAPPSYVRRGLGPPQAVSFPTRSSPGARETLDPRRLGPACVVRQPRGRRDGAGRRCPFSVAVPGAFPNREALRCARARSPGRSAWTDARALCSRFRDRHAAGPVARSVDRVTFSGYTSRNRPLEEARETIPALRP
jgi:hypothetical protein